jgi:hypothetical protein
MPATGDPQGIKLYDLEPESPVTRLVSQQKISDHIPIGAHKTGPAGIIRLATRENQAVCDFFCAYDKQTKEPLPSALIMILLMACADAAHFTHRREILSLGFSHLFFQSKLAFISSNLSAKTADRHDDLELCCECRTFGLRWVR